MTLMIVLGICRMLAQEVMVTVVPVQQVLPPQALMYIDNPGKYFNITLTNTTSEIQNVYLTMNIDGVFPERMSVISTPSTIQPQRPITIAPNRTLHLSMADLKQQFGHLTSRNVQVSNRLLSGYGGGSYGLLPEGRYQINFAAYKWHNPKYASPVMQSNPLNSYATFSVSYLAKAPQIIAPITLQSKYAEVDPLNAQFTWSESLVLSNYTNVRYTYSFKVVEVLPNQPIDYAMENNPAVYHIRNLMSPMCVIPSNYVTNRMSPSKIYAAQVTATPRTNGLLDFVLVENKGKSNIKVFSIVPVHHRMVVPKDTLRDEGLMEFTDGINEDENEYDITSIEEYGQKIMDCVSVAEEMETRTIEYDSIAKKRLREMHAFIATIGNMTHMAAKKAGITDSTKNAYYDIQRLMAEAEKASDIAAIQYKTAYLTLKKLDHQHHNSKTSSEDTDSRQIYDKCAEAVGRAKASARNAQVYYSSIQKTEYLATKQMKHLVK